MALFHPGNRQRSERNERLYAAYEIAYTAVDFAAAVLFILGSILFFDEATVELGTWLFLVGSVFFALRPCLHLAREIHYWRIGRIELLAERALE